MASSAHPAYFKAASYFGIRLIKVPVDPKTLRLTAAAVQKALTAETVLVVASAPSYPHGVVDEVCFAPVIPFLGPYDLSAMPPPLSPVSEP